jgi:hypothetical protein
MSKKKGKDMKTKNILKMLKVTILVLREQTQFDLEIKNKAAQILGYQDYEELNNEWYEKENKSMTEIIELNNSIKK